MRFPLITRILFGIGSLLPGLSLVFILLLVFVVAETPFRVPFSFRANLGIVVAGMVAGFLLGFILALYCIRLVYRADTSESERNFWVTMLLQFFPLAGPLFWYRVIWKGLTVSEATRKA
jgi:hypothetical protein